MNFKGIMLNCDRRNFQKITYGMILSYSILEKKIRDKKLFNICQRLEVERECNFKVAVQGSFFGIMKLFCTDCVVLTQIYTCAKA